MLSPGYMCTVTNVPIQLSLLSMLSRGYICTVTNVSVMLLFKLSLLLKLSPMYQRIVMDVLVLL